MRILLVGLVAAIASGCEGSPVRMLADSLTPKYVIRAPENEDQQVLFVDGQEIAISDKKTGMVTLRSAEPTQIGNSRDYLFYVTYRNASQTPVNFGPANLAAWFEGEPAEVFDALVAAERRAPSAIAKAYETYATTANSVSSVTGTYYATAAGGSIAAAENAKNELAASKIDYSYLKKTTVFPGRQVSGLVLIQNAGMGPGTWSFDVTLPAVGARHKFVLVREPRK